MARMQVIPTDIHVGGGAAVALAGDMPSDQ